MTMRRLVLITLAVLPLVVSCSPSDTKEQPDEAKIKREQIRKELTAAHNAISDLDALEAIRGPRTELFTYEIQRGLTGVESRPLLLEGSLSDIFMQDGTPFIEIEGFDWEEYIIIRLAVDHSLLEKIRTPDLAKDDFIAVVARVKAVDKRLILEADSVQLDEDETELFIADHESLVVTGECIDFRILPY